MSAGQEKDKRKTRERQEKIKRKRKSKERENQKKDLGGVTSKLPRGFHPRPIKENYIFLVKSSLSILRLRFLHTF